MRIDKYLAIALPALAIFLVSKNFLQIDTYPAHDITHPARIQLMVEALRDGQYPPIWAEQVDYKFGYPLFHLYAPLAYFVGSIFHLAGLSPLASYKASLFLAVVVSASGMYKFILKWGRLPAIISSIAYVLLPYLAINIYVRAALAEVWSMALLPWLFWVWSSWSKSGIIRKSLITSLFVISHNLIPLITLPFIGIWALINNNNVKTIVLSTVITFALTCFYTAPLLFERHFTKAIEIAKTSDYRLHFVEPWQLWNSTWGFGGSAPGVEDGMSFKIGKLHLILAASSVFLSAIFNRHKRVIAYFGLFALSSSIMSTNYSIILWNNLDLLQVVQFPWRFLSLTGFFVSCLAGIFVAHVNGNLKLISVLLTVSALIYLNTKYFAPQTYVSNDSVVTSAEYIETTLAKVIPEYQTTWSDNLHESYSDNLITGKHLSSLNIIGDDPITFEVELSADSDIVIHRSYYPTWELKGNGLTIELTPTRDGLISSHLPSGFHRLTLTQTSTTLQSIAFFISTLTLISTTIYLMKSKKII